MKRSIRNLAGFGLFTTLVLGAAALWVSCGPSSPRATPQSPGSTNVIQGAATNAPPTVATNAAAGGTNAPPPGATNNASAATVTNAPPPSGTNANASATAPKPDEIQVAFQGANVEMIIQWLAQTTGKTVIKHPRVQCQLTIVSSKKVSTREAIDLVYRALALEGFNAVETATSILVLPEGQDVKMSPEVMTSTDVGIPEGRQRLLKIFNLNHVQAGEMRDKVRAVLSEKATVEIDDRANRLMVTDFNENLRLLNNLIKELDVVSLGDSVLDVITLKHAEAETLANLMGLILNSQAGASAGGGGGSGRSSPTPASGGGPPMPTPGPGPGGAGPTPSAGSATGLAQPIRLWPDKLSNRLVVSAPGSRMQEVKQLIEILDTDKPEDVAVRTIPLHNVQAVDLVKEISPLYQKMGGTSSKERVEVAANDRSNSLIVLSSESNFESVRQLVASLDTEDAQEKVVRTFPLKNADAQDVAKQLQELSQGADNSSRYPYYIFFSSAERGASSKKMSVVADRRRNALVVQAPPTQIEAIARMIQELDEPVRDDSLAPRIFQLKYVSAVDIEDVLNELFLKRQQNRPYWYYDEFESSQTTDRDVGRLYGKVRITSEPYSNALIITSNSKENLAVVEDILRQLDVPSQAGETTLRVSLRFAKAVTLANNLNILFAKNGSPALRQTVPQAQPNANPIPNQQQTTGPRDASFELGQEAKEDTYYPWLGGTPDNPRSSDGRTSTRQVSDLVGRVRVVADHRSNGLLVSANVHLLPQLMKLIEDLDAPTAQVMIEARIIEVGTDDLDKLGVRWSPDGSKVFTSEDYDGSILAGGSARYLKGFGERTSVNSPPFGNVVSTLNELKAGVLDASVSLDILIQFLRRNTDATVLAEPQINVSDNEMGRLFVGQQVPFINSSQSTDNGGLIQGFDYKSVGIILEVTPHINTSGDVALKIRAESSGIQSGQTLFGGAILDTRNFRTDVTAKSGQTLVLGGIIQKQVSDTVRKVPVLGDIPGLGWAFKKKDKQVRNVELMVFLRPQITRTPEEAQALLEEIDRRAPLLKAWREGEVRDGGISTNLAPVPPAAPR